MTGDCSDGAKACWKTSSESGAFPPGSDGRIRFKYSCVAILNCAKFMCLNACAIIAA
eukprot:CAMPEP_0172698160 /NCGR_PEP_ID=MMETSP1074-20121228/29271_1 /TAXON_ID=2916 /ORGANISM="Ceratium fusus, Strain PA161109" /LENGTH=56 /DNA_ID=CAMNT_0013519153 /DNA_START=11 /DNA_END=177 /DNA_ORIENTATION=-